MFVFLISSFKINLLFDSSLDWIIVVCTPTGCPSRCSYRLYYSLSRIGFKIELDSESQEQLAVWLVWKWIEF
jgi:hypothetical protein